MNVDDQLDAFMAKFGNSNPLDSSDRVVAGEGGIFNGDVKNPYILQAYPDTCAIRSQEIILRDYGINIQQDRLVSLAYEHGWYQPGEGTAPGDIGKLMDLVGVDNHASYNNSVLDLVNELNQGHRVIVGVDSGELWASSFKDVLMEKFEDVFEGYGPDHALIVAGIEVDRFNPEDVKVVLTDPGTGGLRVEYDLETFMDAWRDSECFMVSTDEPAPYQFDPLLNCEVPSNFATPFEMNSFAFDNGFALPSSELRIPEDYSPFYTDNSIWGSEYIDDIWDDLFDDFG